LSNKTAPAPRHDNDTPVLNWHNASESSATSSSYFLEQFNRPSPDQLSGRPKLAAPGIGERLLVVLTTFIFVNQTPDIWFRTRQDALMNPSRPILVLAQFGLIALALVRVTTMLDLIISIMRSELALFALAGFIAFSTIWSVNPAETMKEGALFAAIVLYACYLIIRFPLASIVNLLAAMFIISAVANLAMIVAFPEFAIDRDGHLIGVFSQKNGLGYVSALAIPTLWIAARATTRWQIPYLIAIVTHGFLLVGSDSKTMLLMAIGALVLLTVSSVFRSSRTLRGAIYLALAAAVLASAFLATVNLGAITAWLDRDVTFTGRLPLWRDLWPVVLERPIIGHGYSATFGGYFSPVHEVWVKHSWRPSHAHNMILHLWLDVGIVGLGLYLASYLRGLSRAIRIVSEVPGSVGQWPVVILGSALFVSITESGMQSQALGLTLISVAILSVAVQTKQAPRLDQ